MQPIVQFLLSNGYALAWPLMIIEGPIVTMAMAALASRGYFSLAAVIALGVSADLVSDFLLYTIGSHRWFLRIGRFFGVNSRLVQYLQGHFKDHGGRIIFFAKILPGIAAPTFIAAGLVRFPLKRFYKLAVPGGLIWTGMLAAIGYFFGKYVTSIHHLLTRSGFVVFGLVVAVFLYQYYFGRKIARRTLSFDGDSPPEQGQMP